MSKTIFMQELKMSWRSVITWSVAVAAVIFVFGSLFSSLAEDAELLNEMHDRTSRRNCWPPLA